MVAHPPVGIPALDLRRLHEGASERAAFLTDLRHAAREVGFFTLGGHGIPLARIAEIRALARRAARSPARHQAGPFMKRECDTRVALPTP